MAEQFKIFIEINARCRHVIGERLEIKNEFEEFNNVANDLNELNLNGNRNISFYEFDNLSDIECF